MTPEQIAAKLTKAQREAVLSASGIPDSVEAWGGIHVRRALFRRGLLEDVSAYTLPFDVMTPLGLEVRAILEKQHD